MLRIRCIPPPAVLLAAALAWGGIPGPACAAQSARPPYSKEAIINLLKGEVSPKRVAELARDRGINFQITPEAERELRRAGADDALLSTLRGLAPQPPEKPGEIVVQTSPDAVVYLDGQFVGRASPQGRLVVPIPRAGDHTVRVSLAGKRDYTQHLQAAAGETINLQASLVDSESLKLTAGTVRENPTDGLKYAWIPPGTFTMGCSPGDSLCGEGENPPHPVTITKGFWMGQTEVTVVAYKRFAAAAQRQMPAAPNFNNGWVNDSMPIVHVTWNDASAYCGWVGGRLPTEAEWEYAARAGSTAALYGSLDEVAWFGGNSGLMTHRVGGKRPNEFGLYDMLGNVAEWVNDWYDLKYYTGSPPQDPSGPAAGRARTIRGGSWANFPKNVRASSRYKANPAGKEVSIGFRCAAAAAGP